MKTTPYLGGQVRLDMVCDRLGGDSSLTIDEIHVVPLSDRIWYSGPENQLNYHHSDNVRELYQHIQDQFYSCLGDQLLDGAYPYYSNQVTDTVDHTYQMGLRRIPVARYQKELSYLLPMWIDSEDYIDRIEFWVHVCSASGTEESIELTSKRFTLSDRLRSYLKEYLSGVTSDLMYIGLREHSAYITGLEVSSGTVLTKDVSNLIQNLTERERPLIETDNMLVRKFSENQMIARQLINFNLCFSVADLFSAVVEPSMHWSALNIWCEARLKSGNSYEEIPIKDLYTNYTRIYSYKISDNPLEVGKFVESYTDSDGYTTDYNVLDYLSDYKCLDLIHVNRMLQPTFHWSVRDNAKYTWNLYNGFSPLVEENGRVNRIEGRFFGQPDVSAEEYSTYNNNIQWVTVLDGTSELVPGSFVGLSMNSGSTTLFAPNQYGTCWSKGIRYNLNDCLSSGETYQTVDPETGEYIDHIVTSTGIGVNLVVIKDTVADTLEPNKIYCAVLRKVENNSLRDYISMVYTSTNSDIREYPYIDKMTLLGVRRLLRGPMERSTESEKQSVFELVSIDSSKGEFCELFTVFDSENSIEDTDGSDDKSLVKLLNKCLETVEYPNIIRFSRTLTTGLAPAPSIKHLIDNGTMDVQYTNEIQYYKLDKNYSTYLLRYDGNIVPQFINPELPESTETESWKLVSSGAYNNTYRKIQFSELSPIEVERLNYLSKQKYSPSYPSIGYYYLESSPVTLSKPFLPEGYFGETNWFRDNLMYYTDREFSVETVCTADEMTEEKISEMFTEYVQERGVFKTMENSSDVIHEVLYPMYSHSSDWEYLTDTDICTYKFSVTFSLK